MHQHAPTNACLRKMEFQLAYLFMATVLTANLKFSSSKTYSLQLKAPEAAKNVGGIKIYSYSPFVNVDNFKKAQSLIYSNLDRFSEDYLDVSDLAREGTYNTEDLLQKENEHHRQKHNPGQYNMLTLLTDRRMLPVKRYKKNQNDESADSDFEQDADDNDSSEEEIYKETTPKRFQVIKNSDESSEVAGSESEEYTPERFNNVPSKEQNKGIDKYLYMQGLTRLVRNSDVDRRRRLPHFLPKLVHWNEEDFKDLQNYWISGPRGRYSG